MNTSLGKLKALNKLRCHEKSDENTGKFIFIHPAYCNIFTEKVIFTFSVQFLVNVMIMNKCSNFNVGTDTIKAILMSVLHTSDVFNLAVLIKE